MKLNEAQKILRIHLKKHCLDAYEEVVLGNNLENSFYFHHKYEIAKSESINNYWKFTLGDQIYRAGFGHERIGGPSEWFVDKERGYCFYNLYNDSISIYEEFVLKFKMYNSKDFYLNWSNYKNEITFERAIDLWQESNILDEYIFLSFLKNINLNTAIYKIPLLRNFELLKKNRNVGNKKLIEKLLSKIPFYGYEDETSWQLTKIILELDLNSKLNLHQKTWEEKKRYL